jgi:outer membrane protein TolC
LGRDLRAAFTTEAEPPPSNDEVSLEAAQTKALEQRPEIRQALLKMQKAALEVRREHAEYLPDLSAQLSYVSFPNLNFLPKNVLLAGITFEWQPLDWGQKRHKMSELQSSSKQAVLTEHDAQQQILLDVNASYRKLSEARALLAVDAATQELEREKLRVLTNQYREKAALLTDVLQEQSALAQADAQYRQDLESVWTAKAAFDRALGEQ